jgi:two-component system sensor histidine kinase VicK
MILGIIIFLISFMILLGIIFLIIRYVKPLKDLKNKYEQAEQELVEATRQKNQMETILLHMTDGLIAFYVDEEIIHINPAANKLLKIEDEKTFSEIFSRYEDINLEKIMYLDNWASSRKQITVDDRTINLFFAAFKNENDRPAGIIVVIQDITEHVKLDAMRKSFIADVSHELKTPITSIMGYADTLLETNDVDEEFQKKFLGRISSEAERMAKLVTDLLTLSRFDSSQTRGEKQEFDLGELVKYTYDGLEIEMDKKDLQREFFVTAEVPPVFADKDGIERVVLNILTNAIKYTPEGGSIKVYVGFVYNDAYIKIIDNGIGIPKEDLDKIYERFYRVDKSRTREMGGTGLGLSIAKEILDQNNGTIDITSELGVGTEVVIRIPTKQKRSKQEASIVEETQEKTEVDEKQEETEEK